MSKQARKFSILFFLIIFFGIAVYFLLKFDIFFSTKKVQTSKSVSVKIETPPQEPPLETAIKETSIESNITQIPKLVASKGSLEGGIKIEWDSVDGAQKYALYRYGDASKKWQLISDDLVQNFYIDSDVKKGKEYYYKLKAFQNEQWGVFSKSGKGFVKLPEPANIQVSSGLISSIKIRWDKVEDAKYYRIYRAHDENTSFEQITEALYLEDFEDRNIVEGEYYYYKVKAFNQYASDFSQSQKGYKALQAPKRLNASDGAKTDIVIMWEQDDNAKMYDIYRSREKDRGFKCIATAINDDYYKDKLTESGVFYYYKVKVRKREIEGPFSNIDRGYVAVSPPFEVRASDGSSPYYIDIQWSSAKADYFNLYRAENVKGPYTVVGGKISVNRFRDKSINFCRNYYYKVQAFKNDRASDAGSWDSGYGKCGAFVHTISTADDAKNKEPAYNRPTGIVYQKKYLYIADTFNHRISVFTPNAQRVILAGSGEAGSVDGMGENASFYRPTGIAIDNNGTIYIAEVDNHTIRKITPQGYVSTLAGSKKMGDKDAQGKEAMLNHPYNLALDKEGNLYVTDSGNHKIKKISPEGKVTTFAGNGTKGDRDGSLLYATFDSPSGIAIDSEGVMYVSDSNNNNIRIIKDAQVGHLAGSGISGDKDGTGVSASFNNPTGLAVDKNGNLYVADTGNHKIRIVTKESTVKTIAGSLQGGDKDGFESDAEFFSPRGIALDENNSLYVSDFHAHKIKKITIMSKE